MQIVFVPYLNVKFSMLSLDWPENSFKSQKKQLLYLENRLLNQKKRYKFFRAAGGYSVS